MEHDARTVKVMVDDAIATYSKILDVEFESRAAVLALDRSLDGAIVLLALSLPALTELLRRGRAAAVIAPALALALFADEARFAMPLVRTRPYTEALGSNPVVERLRAP